MTTDAIVAPTDAPPREVPPVLTVEEWRKAHMWLKYAMSDATVKGVEYAALGAALAVTLRRGFPVASDAD